jgi:dTDP-4-amino-4,6-dideoxygalactose transaminase
MAVTAPDDRGPEFPRLRWLPPGIDVSPWGRGELAISARCLLAGRLVRGEAPAALAEEARRALGVRHALPVNRARFAIEMALRALGVGEGSDVVLPSYVCDQVPRAVRRAGARPVFADVGPDLHLGVAELEKALTPRTRCVVVPHLFGRAAPVDEIAGALAGSGIAVLDDAAQSFGARRGGRPVGSFGAFGLLSCGPAKALAGPAGGLLVSDDAELHARAAALPLGDDTPTLVARRVLSFWIWKRAGRLTRPFKAASDRWISRNESAEWRPRRLSNLESALVLAQVRSAPAVAARRRRDARRILAALAGSGVRCLLVPDEDTVPVRLPFLLPEGRSRIEVIRSLASAGVESDAGYPLQHRLAGAAAGTLPVAESLAGRVLLLPVAPALARPGLARLLARLLGGSGA